ncbi:MAG TPA: NADH-quinone oxidoreductase subunit A [Candidatus Paraprevotella stercorigallinarum]|nr:NADH-quinone oxidoreductase subunit A [Candidatus Paraprevotella stercorigallinarum]
MTNFIILSVVLIAAAVLVGAALTVARLTAPRSNNPRKGEPYECGMPPRGGAWMQFKVGYYLYAILFLMFDIETVFLFPWAVRCTGMTASAGMLSIGLFMCVLVLGLAYAWRKGALQWK